MFTESYYLQVDKKLVQ